MSSNKTKPTEESVVDFLDRVENKRRRQDGFKLLELMKETTGEEPVMWGPSMVGFGSYHYKYASGREGDIFKVGFSPRKAYLTIYVRPYRLAFYEDELKSLGKHRAGKGCIYINKLEDIDKKILKTIIKKSYTYVNN